MKNQEFQMIHRIALGMMIGYFLLAYAYREFIWWEYKSVLFDGKNTQWPTEWDNILPISAYLLVLLNWWAYKDRSVSISVISTFLCLVFLGILVSTLSVF